MKKYFLIIFCLLTEYCFGQITFQKSYGTGSEFAFLVEQTSDDGYLLCGNSNGFNLGNILPDAYLIRTDKYGDTLWTTAFNAEIHSNWINFSETFDHGFILTWELRDSLLQLYSCLLILDSMGNEVWNKKYKITQSLSVQSFVPSRIKQTVDGGYILTGTGNAGSAQGLDIILMKTDSAGNVVWCNSFVGPDVDFGIDINETQNGYIIYGTTVRQGYGEARCLLKSDLNGNLLWSWHYGTSALPVISGITCQQTQDSGFIFLTGGATPVITKTDSAGIPAWSVNFYLNQGTVTGNALSRTSNGGCALTGWETQDFKMFLINMDSIGGVNWSKIYGINRTYGNIVEQSSDGGFIVGGTTYDTTGDSNAFLVKADMNGSTGCNESNINFSIINSIALNIPASFITLTGTMDTSRATFIFTRGGSENTYCFTNSIGINSIENPDLVIAPNPIHDIARFHSVGLEQVEKNYNLKIYNSVGGLVKEEREVDIRNYTLSCDGMCNGLFFYEWSSPSGQIATGKFIVE